MCSVSSQVVVALVVGGVVTFSILVMGAAPGATPGRSRAVNPHWKASGCSSCHTPEFRDQAGAPVAIPAARADAVCLSCHDGEKGSEERHAVGTPYAADEYAKPESWPLAEGRLGCLTCHEVKLGCSVKTTRPVLNRPFLREVRQGAAGGRPGAAQQAVPFCQNCHQASRYSKVNPHLMLAEDRSSVLEERCGSCHEQAMDRGAKVRTGKPALKAPQASLCGDCHAGHKDLTLNAHVGRKLSGDVLAYMAFREAVGLAGPRNDKVVEQLKAEKRLPTRMVGDAEGNVTCSTCHNPHPAGVFPKESTLNYLPLREVEGGKVVSPVRSKSYCRHCHEEM